MLVMWKFWFSKIGTREDASSVVKSTSNAFFVIAAVQAVMPVLLLLIAANRNPYPHISVASLLDGLLDPLVFAVLAFIMRRWNSRIAAVGLLFFAVAAMGATIAARIGAVEGGKNVVLAVIAIGA